MIKPLRSFLARFRRDQRGLSAVEFAIIAPLMILLYLGSVELSLALSIDRKVTSTASAIADLVAQDDVITDSEIADILSSGNAIISPFPADPLRIRVSSVLINNDDENEVQWSDAMGTAAYGEGTAVDIPTGVLAGNNSVIMVEVEYRHETIFNELGIEAFEISETFYLRPRRSIVVSRS